MQNLCFVIFFDISLLGGDMNKYFGTDGFRGRAGIELTAEHSFKIGRYLGWYLKDEKGSSIGKRPRVVIGKDPRLSSYMLEYAIASGLASSGADVYLIHVTTTPSVSYVTISEGFDLGVMITASHNPFTDNGIKVIDRRGQKLGDLLAARIEEYIDGIIDVPFASGAEIGRIYDHYSGRNGYIGHLIALANNSYKGLRIGLDSANGASFLAARSVFAALGAEVYSIGDSPDGLNVNYKCGSTHPEALAKLVKEKGLDVGFAFDGDADRCIAIDRQGRIVDGDAILYILAKRLKRQGALNGNKIVATVMSNGGLIKSLADEGIGVEITKVGDRFVYERMQEMGLSLGGEQSGHVILGNLETTGDGIVTAITLAEEMLDTSKGLDELSAGLTVFAQITKSVEVKDKSKAASDTKISEIIQSFVANGCYGRRILVRESGTEPLVRIMAEARTQKECDAVVNDILSALKERGHLYD